MSERRRLIRRLSVPVAIGDLDGHHPVCDEAPWEANDAPLVPINDSETSARIKWSAAGLVPVSIGARQWNYQPPAGNASTPRAEQTEAIRRSRI